MGIDAEMFVRTKASISDEQIKRWNYQLGCIFGHDRFWIWSAENGFSSDRRALMRIDVYEQDGPDVMPKEGETFLELSPGTRYYGQGYERGDLSFLISLAEWCETVIPGAEVWYGGDSSGVLAAPWGMSERRELFEHLCSPEGSDYFTRTRMIGTEEGWGTPRCEFCDMDMTRTGFGHTYAGYICYGCGKSVETRDRGKSWTLRKEVGGNAPRGKG